ncbi:MAG: hypothetical protein IT359_09220 [Gemmatimonadaceae bacterium]|nr:hypothetical protein [Gemmatimonadaceae bacterium]
MCVLLVMLAVLATLGSETSAAQQVRDSSGVRLIRYGARDRAPEWRLESSPLLSIGGAESEGAASFSNIAGVVRLGDGRVVVGDASTNELRVFDQSGDLVRKLGRKGRGPGEFDGLLKLVRVADTVGAVDRAGRLQIFAPDGSLLRSVARPAFRVGALAFQGSYFADWTLLAFGYPEPPDMTRSRSIAPMTVGLVSPDGRDQRIIDTLPGVEVVRSGGGPPLPVQFAPQSYLVVAGERACGGYPLTWEVKCFDRTGRLVSRTVRDVPRAPLSGEARAFHESETMRGMRSAPKAQQDEVREMLRLTQYAPTAPAYGRLIGNGAGEVWIAPFDHRSAMMTAELHPTGSAAQRWSVVGRDGRWLADVQLPARFALLDAGADYVAGIQRDADDVERVVVYRLLRR